MEEAAITRRPISKDKPKPESAEKRVANSRKGQPRKRGGYAGR